MPLQGLWWRGSCSWPNAMFFAVLNSATTSVTTLGGSPEPGKGSGWMHRAVCDAHGSITLTRGGRQYGPSAAAIHVGVCVGKAAPERTPRWVGSAPCCHGQAGLLCLAVEVSGRKTHLLCP